MKQIYTHTQLLALRHECQEEFVKTFFAVCKAQLFYSELQTGAAFRSPTSNTYNSPHSRVSVQYASHPGLGLGGNSPARSFSTSAARASKAATRYTREEVPLLQSFQLVKIPSSLGELPPGSKIVRVSPGIQVPENAIPISIADTVEDLVLKEKTVKSAIDTKTKASHSRWVKSKWEVNYEVPSNDGVTYFAAGSLENQTYYTAPATSCEVIHDYAPETAPSNELSALDNAITKQGLTTEAEVETPESLVIQYHYAPFFEPYISKFPALKKSRETKKLASSVVFKKGNSPVAMPTSSTSYESESATEYSSDSSNIQIQLPV